MARRRWVTFLAVLAIPFLSVCPAPSDAMEGLTFVIHGSPLIEGEDAPFKVEARLPSGELPVLEAGFLLRVEVRGPAEAIPPLLGPDAFTRGSATFVVRPNAVGKVSLSLFHHTRILLHETLDVAPRKEESGKPAQPEVSQAPSPPGVPLDTTAVTPSSPPTRPPAPTSTLDRVVAVAGTALITSDAWDKEKRWDFLPDWSGALPAKDENPASVLERLVDRTILLQRADHLGIRVRSSEVDRELERIEGVFDDEAVELTEFLLERGMSRASLWTRLEEDLRIRELMSMDVFPKLVVPEDDIRAYYEQHAAELSPPEERRVGLITITERTSDKPGEFTARLAALLDEGVAFEVLAREHSEGANAYRGGDIGWIGRGDLPTPLDAAVFTLTPGSHGTVIFPDNAWNLMTVYEVRGGVLPLPKLREAIRLRLFDGMVDTALAEWIEDLRFRVGYEILAR